MAYVPTVWVDDDGSNQVGTEFSADKMNNIEAGIQQALAAGVKTTVVFNWNTAQATGFYRSALAADYVGLPSSVTNGPGDPLAPPDALGIVTAMPGPLVVQRLWTPSTKQAWTRSLAAGVWSAWVVDLSKPKVVVEQAIGGAAPEDGEERYLQTADMKAKGILWRFRYDKTAPPGKPPWVFVGGAGYYDLNDGDNFAVAGGAWTDAGAVGPSWTCPVQGDYNIAFGALIYSNVGGVNGGMTLSVAGVNDMAHYIMHANFGAGYTDYGDRGRENRYDNIATGAFVKAVYASTPTTAGAGFQRRWMKVTPIRVYL